MKMSDIKASDVTTGLQDTEWALVVGGEIIRDKQRITEIARIVNNHDELVEALEVMIACTDKDIYPAFVDQAKEALKQAKRSE